MVVRRTRDSVLRIAAAYCGPQSIRLKTTRRFFARPSSVSTVGGAIGPGLAALFVGDRLYDRVFIMTITLFIAAWLSLWFANRSARSHMEGTC